MGKKKLVETCCSPCYINGMITHLENINVIAKLAEIDTIGFGFVKRIPKWAVKESIMIIQLVKAYDVDTNTLIVDVSNIRINSELIGRALRIRDGVLGFAIPELNKKNLAHLAIKEQFKKKQPPSCATLYMPVPWTPKQNGQILKGTSSWWSSRCSYAVSQQTISPWHIPPILDVSDPSRFNWVHKTFKWLGRAVEKFKSKKHETCGGCMFTLMVSFKV
ncbi:uncharacterized protein DS421_15g493430 [Arachis hypogaea]|nr:uncharacterized protein DS421_15g493430 [Arachis hypogaea]